MSTELKWNLASLLDTKHYIEIFETRYVAGASAHDPINISRLKDFKTNLQKLRSALVELSALTIGSSKDVSKDMLKLVKRKLSKVADMEIDEETTNKDLENFSLSVHEELKLNLYVLEKDKVEVLSWAKENTIPTFPIEALEKVAKAFHSNRKEGVSVFDYTMGKGEHLLAFKDNMSAKEIYTYGTDDDAEKCQIAKDRGVYRVAKEGLRAMSNNTFDISMYFMDWFALSISDRMFYGTSKAEEDFHYFLLRKTVRGGGYIIFNLPYYRIPSFTRKINGFLKVEEIYRTDDEAGNLIFVTTYKKPDIVLQGKKLRTAFLNPNKLEHYNDIDRKFIVDKGDLLLPEMFRPILIDQKDHLEAFKDKSDDFDIIQTVFEPKERVVELNRPLQPYNPGHIPAMATIEITSGIYDTSLHKDLIDGFDYAHISSSKIIQQEVQEKEEEMFKGKLVQTVALKKRNILVFKTLELDGTVREILNTK